MHLLIPRIFIPQDNPQSPDRILEWENGLDTAVQTALAWWEKQLGFQPFAAQPAQAYGLRGRIADYLPDTQEAIRAELALYYPELADTPPFTTVYVVYAALGSAPYECPGDVIGTSSFADSPPVLIVQSSGSLDAFADGDNPADPMSGTRDEQTGALAHEIGHALSLPHPTDLYEQQISVMWSWWLFPQCTITRSEWSAVEAYTKGW